MKEYSFIPEGWNKNQEQISNIYMVKEFIENKKTLQGQVEKCDEQGNLYIKFQNNIKGIIPKEEIEDLKPGKTIEKGIYQNKIHKYVQFKVKEIKDEDILILSRKDVQKEVLNTIKNDLKIGETITGIVNNIKPYGAFIEIGGGVVGLAHIEDLSVARIKTPYERLKIGQKVNVVVKSIDKQEGKVTLSYKETLGTWEENAKKFSVGMNVEGIVRETEKNKNGIFIELTPNLIGMVEYTEGLEYGQKVNVHIKKIDEQRKKVKLILRNNNNQ